jgi:integrase
VTAAAARKLRDDNRKLLARGIDPLEHRKAEEEKKELFSHTFRDAAESYFKTRRVSRSTLQGRKSRFERYVYPRIGDRRVNDIDNSHVINVLQPIWDKSPATAEETRRVMEATIDMAVVMGWRERAKHNPAKSEEIGKVLQPICETHTPEHFAALPWQQLSKFMEDLRARGEVAKQKFLFPRSRCGPPKLTHVTADCLEFLILTGVRRSNALAARWVDINLDERVWRIRGCDVSQDERVGTRMKMKHEHHVPLSGAAIAVLERQLGNSDEWVFPGWRHTPITHKLMFSLLREMGYTDPKSLDQYGNPKPITAHGFRSTFSDWVAEATDYSDDLAELVLAHDTRSQVQAAYKRTKQFDQRRALMEDWATFCSKPPADVIPFQRKAEGE